MFSWLNSEMFINAINIIAAHAVIYLQGMIGYSYNNLKCVFFISH